MPEPEITLKEFSDEASVRDAFLGRSLDLAGEIAKDYAEASPKQKRVYERVMKDEVAVFVSGFYLERLFHLRELKEEDLRNYIEPQLTSDQKDLLPQYLDFLKKTTRLVKTRINYCAMNQYVESSQGKIAPDDERLSYKDKKTGTIRKLQGAALTSKIASLIREKEYGGGKERLTFVQILQREVGEEIEKLDQAIGTRVAKAASDKLDALHRLGQGFTRLVKRIPINRERERRAKLVGSVENIDTIAARLTALVPLLLLFWF